MDFVSFLGLANCTVRHGKNGARRCATPRRPSRNEVHCEAVPQTAPQQVTQVATRKGPASRAPDMPVRIPTPDWDADLDPTRIVPRLVRLPSPDWGADLDSPRKASRPSADWDADLDSTRTVPRGCPAQLPDDFFSRLADMAFNQPLPPRWAKEESQRLSSRSQSEKEAQRLSLRSQFLWQCVDQSEEWEAASQSWRTLDADEKESFWQAYSYEVQIYAGVSSFFFMKTKIPDDMPLGAVA